MRINVAMVLLAFTHPCLAFAAVDMVHAHGADIFHAFRLETDIGTAHDEPAHSWDLDGWIGGDNEKLWLKSEGEFVDGRTEHAEIWALYSRTISTYWDAQLGLRQDWQPHGHSYLASGVMGLAPYGFETDAHVFLREDGTLSARLREALDLPLTPQLIAQPYGELNLNSHADVADGLGTGLTDIQIGLQTRYQLTPALAPYLDICYQSQFGRTADFSRAEGDASQAMVAAVGLRLLF